MRTFSSILGACAVLTLVLAGCSQKKTTPTAKVVAKDVVQGIAVSDLFATPEMYGAIGNDNIDDTEALKKLFGDNHGKTIFIPGKEYLISDTLIIPYRCGIKIQGVAAGTGYMTTQSKTKFRGNISSLVWIGPEDRPMVEYHGSGLVWDGVALFGKRNEKNKTRAKIGFLVHKPRKGIGTGKAYFGQINIFHCETGFQVGKTEGEHNCDNLVFNFFNVGACDVGYRVKNHMGMDHSFDFVRSFGCNTFFYFERGGAIYVRSGGVHHPKNKELLRIGWAGKNNSKYYFSNFKFDAQLKDFKFVVMEQAIPANITLDNFKRSFLYEMDEETGKRKPRSYYNFPGCFHLKGNSKLTITNSGGVLGKHSLLLEKGLPEGDKEQEVPTSPLVIIDANKLQAAPKDLIHPQSAKDAKVRVFNCFDRGNNWYPNFEQ